MYSYKKLISQTVNIYNEEQVDVKLWIMFQSARGWYCLQSSFTTIFCAPAPTLVPGNPGKSLKPVDGVIQRPAKGPRPPKSPKSGEGSALFPKSGFSNGSWHCCWEMSDSSRVNNCGGIGQSKGGAIGSGIAVFPSNFSSFS